jgi:tetratricopeptide (TPR) repeat protein
MKTRVELRGTQLLCRSEDPHVEGVRQVSDSVVERWRKWASDYNAVLRRKDHTTLPALGRDIFTWLDGEDRWLTQSLDGVGAIYLEIAAPASSDMTSRAFLDMPWELLASQSGFLAADSNRPFCVWRRMGASGAPFKPLHEDFALIFMAASPEGVGELNFEAEEAAIIQATNPRYVRVMVEESGCLEFLRERTVQEGPIEALHLSCHGDVAASGALLALESPEGLLEPVTAGKLVGSLGEHKPPLVFLSACRTAEHVDAATPLTEDLIRAGVPNVLGWDGSVYDSDAIAFARTFYAELSRQQTVAYSAALARQHMLHAHLADTNTCHHWHLARAYAGPTGGGIICQKGADKRPRHAEPGYTEFLDKDNRKSPVANRAEFVGRRRHIQAISRAFNEGTHAGVLVHGMGQLGKSSLAARVANRLGHHRTVVVFDDYRAIAIFDAVAKALPGDVRPSLADLWRPQIAGNESRLYDALRAMLEGPLATEVPADPANPAKPSQRPVLLIIDDFEQVLEAPRPGEDDAVMKADHVKAIAATIAAFRDSVGATESRLLVTSRYRFALTDPHGNDLAAALHDIQLVPMNARERDKQLVAAVGRAGFEIPEDGRKARDIADLMTRAKTAASGNPGLQAILMSPLLKLGGSDATEAATDAVEDYLRTGMIPQASSAAADFFGRVSFEVYKAALTPDESLQLRAALICDLPMPLTVHALAGSALGVDGPERAIARLLGLGLLDLYVAANEPPSANVNGLTKPLFAALTREHRKHLAKAVVAPLFEEWSDDSGDLPMGPRAVALADLAFLAEAEASLVNRTGLAAAGYFYHGLHQADRALQIVVRAIEVLRKVGGKPDLHLLRIGADSAERIGNTELQDQLLEQGLASDDQDAAARAMLAVGYANRLRRRGHSEQALTHLTSASVAFEKLGDKRSLAVTKGRIADILDARGDLDAALKIRTEEELPTYEKLGDVRELAVSKGKIADILFARGDLDAALKIRIEEELPTYEKLGDVRSLAVSKGKIADILFARGDLDAALKIRAEEQLPIFEKLGDVRSLAITKGQIADILSARGDLDAALKIRAEEQLPIFEKLGDVRELAITKGKIADILFARGDLDAALKIRTEEQLPIFEKLGDVRALAVTKGWIADILFARGDLDAALKIRTEEQLPIFEKLGDVRELAVTKGKISDILYARGDIDAARRLHLENLSAAERMGNAELIMHAKFSIAHIGMVKGISSAEEAQLVSRYFLDAYATARSLKRPDSIAAIGMEVTSVLRSMQAISEAKVVAEEVAVALEKLGHRERADEVRSQAAQWGSDEG